MSKLNAAIGLTVFFLAGFLPRAYAQSNAVTVFSDNFQNFPSGWSVTTTAGTDYGWEQFDVSGDILGVSTLLCNYNLAIAQSTMTTMIGGLTQYSAAYVNFTATLSSLNDVALANMTLEALENGNWTPIQTFNSAGTYPESILIPTSATGIGFEAATTDTNDNCEGYPWAVLITSVTVTAIPYPAVSAPSSVTGRALGTSSISWAWGAATNAAAYDVYEATSPSTLILNTGGLAFTENGLSTNTAYGISVEGLNSGGTVGPSISTTIFTLAAAPTALAFSDVAGSSIAVSWSPNTNPSPTLYQVQYWQNANAVSSMTTTTTSAVVGNLVGLTAYSLTVNAINGNGIPAPSGVTLSTVTLPVYSSTITVGAGGGSVILGNSRPAILQIPPGAFSQATSVTLTALSSFPAPNSAAAVLRATGVGVDVLLSPDVEPTEPVTLTLSYLASDVAGLDAESLILARYDDSRSVWVPLASSVDAAGRSVSAQTDHLSLFELRASEASTTISTAKVFPNPWKVSGGPAAMTFSDLPASARVRIYALNGLLIKEFSADESGLAQWDGTNEAGVKVASGFYFAFVQGAGQERTLKLAVER